MLFRLATWTGRVMDGKVSTLAATLVLVAGACANVARGDIIISNYPLERRILCRPGECGDVRIWNFDGTGRL